MGNQSLHSSSTSCWLSICHARKMNAERLSLFLCFHSLLRLNWSRPLPLILRAALGVFTQVREQWEGPSISTRTAIPSVLCLCANVEGVLQSPIYNSLIFKEWNCFLIIYLFTVLFCWSLLTTVAALLTEQGRVLNLQNSLEKIINQAVQ